MSRVYTFAETRSGYSALWAKMHVLKLTEASAQARAVIACSGRYLALEKRTGVPWFVIGVIHLREAGLVNGKPDFLACLHNGQRIIGTSKKTTLVPVGRGPFATFEDSAVDALKDYEGDTWSPEFVAYTIEKFNGFGYRQYRGIPSPYLWGGTSVQERGKYVKDGVYDPDVMDPQIGGMAVLKQIMALDATARFGDVQVPDTPVVPPSLPPAPPTPAPQKSLFTRIIDMFR